MLPHLFRKKCEFEIVHMPYPANKSGHKSGGADSSDIPTLVVVW